MRVPACGGVSHARDAVRSMMIADSPSLPRKALASALDVTHSFGLAVEVIGTREFENELYVSNPPNRCYFCKAELFTKMEMLAAECGFLLFETHASEAHAFGYGSIPRDSLRSLDP